MSIPRGVALGMCVVLSILVLEACGTSGGAPSPAPSPGDGALSTAVVVPDVVAAIEKHRHTPAFTEDPDATASMLRAYAEGLLEGAGLEPDIQTHSGASVSQVPAPGTEVPRGTVVHVRINVGD